VPTAPPKHISTGAFSSGLGPFSGSGGLISGPNIRALAPNQTMGGNQVLGQHPLSGGLGQTPGFQLSGLRSSTAGSPMIGPGTTVAAPFMSPSGPLLTKTTPSHPTPTPAITAVGLGSSTLTMGTLSNKPSPNGVSSKVPIGSSAVGAMTTTRLVGSNAPALPMTSTMPPGLAGMPQRPGFGIQSQRMAAPQYPQAGPCPPLLNTPMTSKPLTVSTSPSSQPPLYNTQPPITSRQPPVSNRPAAVVPPPGTSAPTAPAVGGTSPQAVKATPTPAVSSAPPSTTQPPEKAREQDSKVTS